MVLLPFCLASHLVIGQEQAPLQADVQLQVKYNDKRPVLFRARLEVVLTSERAGNEFSKVTIDPNTVYLNLNRSSLSYSATLYPPPRDSRNLYLVRIQVFGNYE